MNIKLNTILIGLLFFFLPSTMVHAAITGAAASENFLGKISSDNEDRPGTIFTTSDHLSGSISFTVDPVDVGQVRPLYLAAKFNGKWYVYDNTGNWKTWTQQLHDLTPFTSRALKQLETIDLPLDYAKQEGQYAIFAGYLNSADHIIFNKHPVSFTVFDESKTGLRRFSSSAMLEQFLKEGLQVQTRLNTTQNNLFFTDDLVWTTTGTIFQAGTESAATHFSTTNIQEAGVEEADRIKTDGTTVYILNHCGMDNPTLPVTDEIEPLSTSIPFLQPRSCLTTSAFTNSSAGTQKLSQIALNDSRYFDKLYLVNSQTDNQSSWLIAVGQAHVGFNDWHNPWRWQSQKTELQWINVDHAASPEMMNLVTLDGSLVASRRIDRTLYVVTRFTPWIQDYNNFPITEEEFTTNEALLNKTGLPELLPTITIDQQKFDQLVAAENCYLPPVSEDFSPDPSIITITAIPIDNPDEVQSTCIVGSSETLYMSPESLYLATTQFPYQRFFVANQANITSDEPIFNTEHKTEIHKFSVDGSQVTYQGSGEVTGHLGWHEDKKPFRMSEYNDVLRIATSVGDNWMQTASTRLSTLKLSPDTAQLEIQGTLENLGKPGEHLYASRFMGDRGYLVTFRVTDPLYTLDLSDPSAPEVLGELEIEGYSDYLHPINENYIVGIGKDAIPDSQSDDRFGRGAWYQGLKLSLFDVSNPNQPVEVNSIVLGKRGTESDVLYDHHALAYLPPNDMRGARLAIPVRLHEETPSTDTGFLQPWAWYDHTHTGLYLFDIDVEPNEKGIKQRGEILLPDTSDYQTYPILTDRAILTGDNVHYIHDSNIISRNWLDF